MSTHKLTSGENEEHPRPKSRTRPESDIGEFTVITEGKRDMHFFPTVPVDPSELVEMVISDIEITYVSDTNDPIL